MDLTTYACADDFEYLALLEFERAEASPREIRRARRAHRARVSAWERHLAAARRERLRSSHHTLLSSIR